MGNSNYSDQRIKWLVLKTNNILEGNNVKLKGLHHVCKKSVPCRTSGQQKIIVYCVRSLFVLSTRLWTYLWVTKHQSRLNLSFLQIYYAKVWTLKGTLRYVKADYWETCGLRIPWNWWSSKSNPILVKWERPLLPLFEDYADVLN